MLLNLGRIAATRLDSEGLKHFRARVEEDKAVVGAYPYWDRWIGIIDSDAEATAAMLTDETEDGRYIAEIGMDTRAA